MATIDLRAALMAALLALGALAAPAIAQVAPPPAEADAPEAAAEAETAPDADAAAEDEAPPPPADLTDPAVDSEEFSLRLIPLTAEELGELAGHWLGVAREATIAVVEQQIAVNRAEEGEAADAARERLADLTEARRVRFDRLVRVLDAWELKGGDPDAIASMRTYRNSVLVEEARRTDWRTLVSQATAWATSREGGIALAMQAGIVLAAFLGLLVVAGIVKRIVRRWIGHVPNLSKLLQAFVVTMVYWLVLAFGLMVVLAALGVNITPLFALVGGASFILAFALQNTLSNLAAGLMIMVNRPFDKGDAVTIGGTSGTVSDVSIMSTTVVTPDNQIVIVPNSSVWGTVITNSTASDTRRVDLEVEVSHDMPIAEAQAIIERTVRAHPLVLEDPEAVVRVNGFTDSTTKFVVRPWARNADYQTVFWDLTRGVREALDAAGARESEAKLEAAEAG